jgi:hypothetical protein
VFSNLINSAPIRHGLMISDRWLSCLWCPAPGCLEYMRQVSKHFSTLGSIMTIPYSPHIPASSKYQTYRGSVLFTEYRLTPSDRCLVCFFDRHRNMSKVPPPALVPVRAVHLLLLPVSSSNRVGLAGGCSDHTFLGHFGITFSCFPCLNGCA